jgi:predicted Zn-dependent protease
MSSWFGWLFILFLVYLAVVVVRGIIQFASWAREEFFPGDRDFRRWEGQPEGRLSETVPDVLLPPGNRRKKPHHHSYKRRILVAAAQITLAHWLGALTEFTRRLVSGKRYDYWVGAALGEEDPAKKVKYLSKALALEPGYAPAWGLKGDALFSLQRHDEAIGCFDKVLDLDPDAATWYWKGLCCFHLGRMEQAVECFNKTLAARTDRRLHDDAERYKKQAQAQMLTRTAPAADPMPRAS